MRAVDIIQKKKEGKAHTKEEIDFLIKGLMDGTVEDYQMSSWLMAVCFQGLNEDETAYMTEAFINSGEILNFSDISDTIADKHSTGGVGDKVTIILIPLLAALGVKCAKLSGRGLGYTGGTVDKLESIPNFKCQLEDKGFKAQIKNIGAAISAQTPNLTPADGKIYALRDVTATVDNKSLICASVVSKKIASGANIIVLDVKYGSGAFIKTKEEARELADLMIRTGAKLNRKIEAVISSMEQPLGTHIGNSLEVIESVEFLKGNYNKDLYEIVLEIAGHTLILAKIAKDFNEAKAMIDEAIKSGSALQKLKEIIKAQGGNPDCTDNYNLFNVGKNKFELKAEKEGYIAKLDALNIAKACKLLGAGRDKKTDSIDFGAGCILHKKTGEKIKKGDTLLTLYWNDILPQKIEEAKGYAALAFEYSPVQPEAEPIIYREKEILK